MSTYMNLSYKNFLRLQRKHQFKFATYPNADWSQTDSAIAFCPKGLIAKEIGVTYDHELNEKLPLLTLDKLHLIEEGFEHGNYAVNLNNRYVKIGQKLRKLAV